jgi:hypothetical protein
MPTMKMGSIESKPRGAPRGVEQRVVRGERARVRSALAPLAALEIAEGIRVPAEVLGLLRERVVEMQLRVRARARSELALDLHDLLGREGCLRDLSERRPCPVVLRIELERAAISVRRAREIADELLRRAEIVVVLRLARVACDGASKGRERLGVRARVREHDPDRVERQGTMRLECERPLRGLERVAGPVQRDQTAAALCVVLRPSRVAREREIDDLERLAEVAVLGRDHREQEERRGAARIRAEDLDAELVRALEVASVEGELGLALERREVGGDPASGHAPES